MKLVSETHDGVQVVTMQEPRIDAAIAIQFKDEMRSIAEPEASRVVLNLEHVDFIDSSGLGAVVASMKQLAEGQKMDLAALTPTVEKVFRLTRMDMVFDIYASAEKARFIDAQ